MDYNFQEIEKNAKQKWEKAGVYKVDNNSKLPKYYVLDMFPYPSGSGLHVGHPLGYIASDIISRYKKLKGFNVLHPMGFDAFGLPAEQYAIQTGKHPAITTEENIATYKNQLGKIGFCYDWSREVNTSKPDYYKWTQWIFLQLFDSWYDTTLDKARRISELEEILEKEGNVNVQAACNEVTPILEAEVWNRLTEKQKSDVLMCYRLAYQSESMVNWCEGLGTVLANDEVKEGVSERGGFPVEQKKMTQWFLRITAYAERLISSLDDLDWTESMKEMQRNWIGKSYGASVFFKTDDGENEFEIFTTRVDTIFGATFMVLAPEHSLIAKITKPEQQKEIDDYVTYVNSRSEVERQQEKKVTGAFTGAYAINPFNGDKLPIYISEYVLAGYGTGAIMAVPSDDERDEAFAKKFNIPIIEVIDKSNYPGATKADKLGIMINSDFINGMEVPDAIQAMNKKIEEMGIGQSKVNYRLRDAGFSRQRYWGEPFPIYYENGIPKALKASELPLELPKMEEFKPAGGGKGPLFNAKEWLTELGSDKLRETDTMPGYAGSSWYFLRYMDPHNEDEFVSKKAVDYWQDIDLYIGGTEHAVGHLLYSRFWHKFFKDNDWVVTEEPYKKLVNQGMIQGQSAFAFCVVALPHENNETSNGRYFINVSKAPLYLISKEENDLYNSNPNAIEIDVVKKREDLINRINKKLEVYSSKVKSINEFGAFKINDTIPIRIPISCLERGDFLAIDKLKNDELWKKSLEGKEILLNDTSYICHREVEKMSKSKFNVVNPDEVIGQYGADCFRMFEMFLGPIETAKPWDTQSIGGVSKFLAKLWRLFDFNEDGTANVTDREPTNEELKILHKTIKKVTEDIEKLSFNTAVSAFMVCVNELGRSNQKSQSKAVLADLVVLLAPFAPFTAEALWEKLGYTDCLLKEASYPTHQEKFLVEDTKTYPISINGKMRTTLDFSADADKATIEAAVLANEVVQKWLVGKAPKKVIVVPGKIVNVVM